MRSMFRKLVLRMVLYKVCMKTSKRKDWFNSIISPSLHPGIWICFILRQDHIQSSKTLQKISDVRCNQRSKKSYHPYFTKNEGSRRKNLYAHRLRFFICKDF